MKSPILWRVFAYILLSITKPVYLYSHGIAWSTVVQIYAGKHTMQHLYEAYQADDVYVVGYNVQTKRASMQRVKELRKHSSNCCVVIGFGPYDSHDIIGTPTQEFYIPALDTLFHKKNDRVVDKNGAQAPGLPTKDDGFIPPKRWEGKKTRDPKSGRAGWPDENGHIWIPTGPRAHRGPHWDVQNPKTGKHRNVLSGGKIC